MSTTPPGAPPPDRPQPASADRPAQPRNAPCASCGSTDWVSGVLYHKANCKLYAGGATPAEAAAPAPKPVRKPGRPKKLKKHPAASEDKLPEKYIPPVADGKLKDYVDSGGHTGSL